MNHNSLQDCFKNIPLSMLILGQKSCISGPTIFKIPQPNWHYCTTTTSFAPLAKDLWIPNLKSTANNSARRNIPSQQISPGLNFESIGKTHFDTIRHKVHLEIGVLYVRFVYVHDFLLAIGVFWGLGGVGASGMSLNGLFPMFWIFLSLGDLLSSTSYLEVSPS